MLIVLLSSCSRPSSPGAQRTLNFPAERSLGTLYIVERNLHFTSGSGEVKKAEAQGTGQTHLN